ncbi:replication initiator [Streptacidiphilus sp. PB12-B1b]|uniref:replication initiator n=1 Tax=Streptacidiphilus sp. PB12-B1b TaxID=2705012 RepID=UPI00351A10BE
MLSESTVFRFGRQIDVRAIRSTHFTDGAPVTDRHFAAYIAKYATKGAETTTGTLDRRLRFLAELAQHDLTDHARQMIHTAWHLGAQLQHAHLRLRQWAHMLGFRGHFSTRTRHYSTTLTHLRAERTAWRTRQDDAQERPDQSQSVTDRHSDRTDRADLPAVHIDPNAGHRSGRRTESGRRIGTDTTLVISHWQYIGSGLLPELAHLADLLTAARNSRPEQPTHSRKARRSGDRAAHSTDPLTAFVHSEVTA